MKSASSMQVAGNSRSNLKVFLVQQTLCWVKLVTASSNYMPAGCKNALMFR